MSLHGYCEQRPGTLSKFNLTHYRPPNGLAPCFGIRQSSCTAMSTSPRYFAFSFRTLGVRVSGY